ncbi:ribulose bisphosphate carboxylase/oxygenase activase, chloroplastic-like isoform X2 [Apium graveolens]|uniref:ribulose bisphosphate carboxylase/oxygenase activase, chloroplastic-like isoform X2 n=1 Tax=Apium graveolens TaxID=4045 RepID=UPI003D798596
MNILIEKKSYKPKMWTEVWTSCYRIEIMASVICVKLCGSLGMYKGNYVLHNSSNVGTSVLRSTFTGKSLREARFNNSCINNYYSNFKIVAEVDEEKQSSMDRWKGLAFDISDDQQDITRGKGMVDSLFQAPMNSGFTNSCTSRTVSYIKCI